MDRISQIQSRIDQIESLFKPGAKQQESSTSFEQALNQLKQQNTTRIDSSNMMMAPQMNSMMMNPMMPMMPMSPVGPMGVNKSGYINPCPTGKLSPYAADDGLDIHAPQGTPVYAAKDGVVVYNDAGGHSAWEGPGNDTGAIRIKHADGTEAWYAHLSGRNENLKPGDFVKAGTPIGNVGTANNVPHLHMSIFYSSGGDAGGFMDPFEMEAMFKNQQGGGAYAMNQMNPAMYGMNNMYGINNPYGMNNMMMNQYGMNQYGIQQQQVNPMTQMSNNITSQMNQSLSFLNDSGNTGEDSSYF